MKEAAQRIIDTIQEHLADPDVQPGYPDANGNTKTTWCNRFAHRIATILGGDMDPFLEKGGINWTSANAMYRNAGEDATEICARAGEVAQFMANDGGLVLAACYNPKGSGHVALVCPSPEEYSDELGPLVGEAGARCRITHSKLAFEKYGYQARFFIIPKKEAV
jgi:hypothetical protein